MAQPIRVLHCVAGLGRGGYEAFIMNVYRNIDREKVQFDFLYSFDGVHKEEIKKLGGRLYQIPFITQKGPFVYTDAVRKFFKEHKEYKIVHSHMDKFSGLIMREAKKAGVPVRIAHSHNTANEGGIAFKAVKNYYGSMIKNNCTYRFACSFDAAKWMFPGFENSALVVKNGIDTERYQNSDTRDKDLFTVCAIGRFTRQKNHAFLMEVFKDFADKKPNARLLLAGTGMLTDKVKQQAEKLGITDKVTFLGDCNDVPALLHKSDIMCMPSLFEGLGIVLIEAQCCGVKCLASTNVPKEAKISEDIQFLPLDKQLWVEALLNTDTSVKNNNRKQAADCGYDIKETAKMLEKFYLENY